VLKALKALKDLLVLLVQQAQEDSKDLLASQVPLDLQVTLDPWDQLVYKALLVHQALLVLLE